MLEIINIEMIYNKVILVLKGVSLQVPEGGIVALLGANGAGKTSTLKCISGLEHAEEGEVTRGQILFEGKQIEQMDPTDIVRLGVVQVVERCCIQCEVFFSQHMVDVELHMVLGKAAQPKGQQYR